MFKNKLNITDEIELSKTEEKITKLKALDLYDSEEYQDYFLDVVNGVMISF